MQSNMKKTMGWKLVLPAVLILSQPIVAFFDVLPDSIGYLLFCFALMRLADLNETLAEAMAQFKRMIWISLGVFAMQAYIYGVLSKDATKLNPYEIPTMVLLGSFALCALQICFLLPAYRNFFTGMNALCDRYGSEERIRTDKKGYSQGERMARRAGVYVVVTSLLSLLPELSVLTTFEYEMEKLPFDWYRFIGLFRVTALLVSAVLFVVFAVRFARWWHAVFKDERLMQTLESRYEAEILPCTEMLMMRRLRFAIVFLTIGSGFVLNLRIEQHNLLPGIFGAVFIGLGVWIFGEYLPHKKSLLLLSAFLGAISVGQIAFNRYYTHYYSYEESGWDLEAYRLFFELRLTEMAEALLFAFLLCELLRALLSFVKEHVCEQYAGASGAAVSAAATERLQKKFRTRIYATVALFCVSAICSMTEIFFQLQYAWMWWISLALTSAAITCFASLLYALLDHLSWQAHDTPVHKRD